MDISALSNKSVAKLFEEQLAEWEQAKCNYEALQHISSKSLDFSGIEIKVQFNPARIVSSAAKVDQKSINERKCFLCDENRPVVQKGLDYKGLAGEYQVLINPFPIFPKHLTIPSISHVDQCIKGRFMDMLNIASIIDDYVLFYNGPRCGASAPDHMHFQGGNKGFLPLEQFVEDIKKTLIADFNGANLFSLVETISGTLLIEGKNKDSVNNLFEKLYALLPIKDGEWEPMLNIVAWYSNGKYYTLVFLRDKHRPSCYFAEGDDNILLSPASVDLGGVFITPLEKDFNKIGLKDIKNILDEVTVKSECVNSIIEKVKK